MTARRSWPRQDGILTKWVNSPNYREALQVQRSNIAFKAQKLRVH